MCPIMVGRRLLGWLGLLAMAAVAGCTAGSPVPGHSPAATTAISPGAPGHGRPAGPGGVRSLVVSRNLRNELTVAYVVLRGIPLSDVAGTIPGSVYYAYDPATGTYWAEAIFEPSSTASVKVLVGFQDGASVGFFTKPGNSGWEVQEGGAPPVCTETLFFPPAVLRAWSLPTDTAGLGCGGSQPRWPTLTAPARVVSSLAYAVTMVIPSGWRPTPLLGSPAGFGYDGTSGWVELNAMAEPYGLHYACTVAATGNVLHPYGLHPQIIYRAIDGRPGCLIFPSSDARALARRAGGPAFRASAALVEYRQSAPIGGSAPMGGCISLTGRPCTFALLEIGADPAHLVAIVDSVLLNH
jgi:hypothetical protein